jgi:hypothetical protein
MTCYTLNQIDEIQDFVSQARAIVLGLSLALNSQDGEPSLDIVQGMLASAAGLLDDVSDMTDELILPT